MSNSGELHQAVAAREGKSSVQSGSIAGGGFLTFFLGNEEYGVEILKVQEIIGVLPITPVPRTAHFIRGVINLRGKVIPVVDLRLKFGMPGVEHTSETCIIVVNVHGINMGTVVDKVSEVVYISSKDIEEPPSFGSEVNTDFILGIGKSQAKVKILLDIDKVLATHEVASLHTAASEGAGNAAQQAGVGL